MPRFPQSGVELVAETSRYSQNINSVIADAGRVDNAMGDIVRSANRAEDAINSLDGSVDVRIDTSLGDDAAIRRVENIQDNQDVRLDVKEGDTSAIEDIEGRLNAIQALATINLILLLPANLQNISDTLANLPIIDQLIEMDNAVASVNARVINEIPRAGQIINDIYVQNWGESRQQIADTLVLLDQFGVSNAELEDAATGAFQAAAISGEDMNAIIDAADKLVSNNLTGSYREAFDFITRGFQEGFNSGEDFLDTIREYTPVFADNSLSMQGLFNILNTGMEEGVRNTDYLADAFKEMLNLTREEISVFDFAGDETDRTRALQQLGLGDSASAFAAGEITGDAFADGLIESLNQVADPAEQRRLALAIFNPTMIENVGLGPLLAMDIEQSTELEAAWENAAEEGANIMTATVGNAFSELSRTIEVEMGEAIANALNLDVWLDEAKGKIQVLADELQAGTALPEALEIALEAPGLADKITQLEGAIGNFTIEFALGVANILQGLGHMDAAMDIRGAVLPQVRAQLAFDLDAAQTESDMAAAVENALRRGIQTSDIPGAARAAMAEAIAAGDFQQALDIGGVIDAQFPTLANVMGSFTDRARELISEELQGVVEAGAAAAADAESDAFASALREPLLLGTEEAVAAAEQAAIDEINDMGTRMNEALASGDFDLAATLAEELNMPEWAEQIRLMEETSETGFDAVAAAAEQTSARIANAVHGRSIVPDIAMVSAAALIHMPITGAAIITMGGMAEAGFSHATTFANIFEGAIMGLGNVLPILQGINAELSAMASLGSTARDVVASIPTNVGGGGGGGNTSNTTINVNQTNNNQSSAQVASANNQISAGIRGL